MKEVRNSGILRAIPLMLIVVLFCPFAHGKVIHVDDDGQADFDNIQAGIDVANDGDTVLVAPGEYVITEPITFRGKAITVRSEAGPEQTTIRISEASTDLYADSDVVLFENGEDAGSLLEGLKLTGSLLSGVSCIGSSPSLENCVITANYQRGVECLSSSPTITNCIISGSVGDSGVNCRDGSSPTITNCIISGNSAIGSGGGGVYCNDSSPTITNCIISGNAARSGGGVQCIFNSSPTLNNCILWNNTPDEIYLGSDASATITYSDVQGGWLGEGNIDSNPLFVDPAGDDNIIGTEDDDLRLLGGSPCFDTGNNAAVPTSVVTDRDGNPRIINGKVDMGAYESPTANFILSTSSLVIPEGQTATFTVALTELSLEIVDVTVAHYIGDRDIKVESGGLLTFSAQDYMEPQTVTLVAAEDSDNLDGTARIRIGAHAYPVVKLVVKEWDNESLYVDADAPGANNGSSWDDAYVNLQDALSLARANLEIHNIHVAQGVYTPDRGADLTPGDRIATFQLIDGVTLKGGFAGFGEPDPNSRDIDLYETILSGDLLGDDIESLIIQNDPFGRWRDEPPFDENSYHVVTSNSDNPTAVLDGFTVTGGNADGGYGDAVGSGLYNGDPWTEGSSITVLNCTFIRNYAGWGGGMISFYCNPTLVNCKFRGNYAADGGGINIRGNPKLVNCTFSDNFAIFHGWGASTGGGMYNNGSPTLINCVFFRNQARSYGGAIYNRGNPTLVNCTFTANTLNPWSKNSNGGAIYSRDGMVTLTNCILWGDQPNEIALDKEEDSPLITYTNIQGGWPDSRGIIGIIDADPLFTDPDNGDYHLKSQAGRWDPISQSWIIDDVTSPCIDAGDSNSDCMGETWPHGGRINMGAYGGTREASMSTQRQPMTLPNVSYIYSSDIEAAQNFQSLLTIYGCSTDLVSLDEIPTTALDTYDLIIVGNDTGKLRLWDDVESVTAIESSDRPIIGLGEGGYAFFGKLGLSIGWPYGWHGNENSIYVVDSNCPLFDMPYPISVPDDRVLQLYTQTNHVGIYLALVPDTILTLGSEIPSPTHYPLVLQHDRYLLWGFTESPQKMTETGKTLFVNIVIRTANAALEIEI
ncbi:MAG: hypothetical protein GY774_17520 [Planctomycetes bacterium]|nr:hypothetical protein [Planctomycetota bacterium]